MIPRGFIAQWRATAPWDTDAKVEQDLIISRAIVEIFSHPLLSSSLAFRGGTALYKLFMSPAARYSEDIDLVQMTAGPIGPVFDALHEKLTSWLGEPRRKLGTGIVNFIYRMQSEESPPSALRLKVEIKHSGTFFSSGNSKEEFYHRLPAGSAEAAKYRLSELRNCWRTKLRALYQRRKGRGPF